MTVRRALQVVFVLLLLAGLGLLIPGGPAYLPSLVVHYSHYHQGHSLGYWVRALDQPDEEVRYQAIFALGTIGPDAAEAVPALATILTEDPDPEARHRAALALARATAGTTEGVAALTEALENARTAQKRLLVARALGEVGAPARVAESQLRALLANDSPAVREAAAEALRKIMGG